jgi:hypothetical protein
MKEIDFINAKMNRQNVTTPQFLYKYRLFDEHTFDMLDNGYVYLCPAERLDDPSECKVDFSVQDLYDIATDQLKFKCVESLLELVKPYTSEDNFRQVQEIVYRTLTPTGLVRRNYLLEASFALQELAPEMDIAPLINFLGNIPEKLDEPKIQQNIEKLFSLAYNAKQEMGICSLSTLKNFDEMWRNYADDSKGYCIEYDTRNYENLYALYPVVYQDNRESNIVTSILSAFIGEMIFGMSNGQIAANKSQFIRLFLTKDLVWSYQKEWRLLGDANQKLSVPPVNAIYLGKNMLDKDKQQMIEYCKMHDIRVEEQI